MKVIEHRRHTCPFLGQAGLQGPRAPGDADPRALSFGGGGCPLGIPFMVLLFMGKAKRNLGLFLPLMVRGWEPLPPAQFFLGGCYADSA